VVECHKIANLKGLKFPAHMISCLTEIPLYPLIIYIDGRILWCTHSLLLLETCLMMIQKSLPKVSINITWSTGSFKAHIWYSIFLSLASSTFTNNVYTQQTTNHVSRKIKSFEVSNFVAFHHYCAIRLICNYIFLSGYIGRNIVLIYLVRLMTPK
jgi:hypothetical protein